jgi:outer membrane protein assembly factor BamB
MNLPGAKASVTVFRLARRNPTITMDLKSASSGSFWLAVILSALTAYAADDWPEFRGPTGQGLSAATNVPISWSATNNIVWKITIPGDGWSSPVLVNGKIYLTTAINESSNITLHALCVNARDGRMEWNEKVFQPDSGDTKVMHKKNSLASPTPIVRDGRIYVHFGHMGTAALDLNGKTLWRQAGLKYPPTHGNGGSPALLGDQLIFGCDGGPDPLVAALDTNTGAVRWKTPRNTTASRKFSFSTPLAIEVNGAPQIISPGSGFVGGYNPKNGAEIWRVRYGEGYSVITRPVYAHGLLFISSSYDRPVLYAIKPADAKGDVTDTHVAWTHSKGVPNTPSPLVVGEELYFVSDGGIATCLDARTGNMHWNERIGGGYSASPVFAEGRLYFQNEEGVGTVLKAGKTFEVLAKNDIGERTLASIAVTDNTIFLRSKSHLWRIGK